MNDCPYVKDKVIKCLREVQCLPPCPWPVVEEPEPESSKAKSLYGAVLKGASQIMCMLKEFLNSQFVSIL